MFALLVWSTPGEFNVVALVGGKGSIVFRRITFILVYENLHGNVFCFVSLTLKNSKHYNFISMTFANQFSKHQCCKNNRSLAIDKKNKV